jgi:hypothetical protein
MIFALYTAMGMVIVIAFIWHAGKPEPKTGGKLKGDDAYLFSWRRNNRVEGID